MIKVDEIYPLDIYATIGPAGTIKRLFKNNDYFKSQGIDMSIFVLYPVGQKLLTYKYALKQMNSLPGQGKSFSALDTINSSKWKSTLKSKIKKKCVESRFLSVARLRRDFSDNRAFINDYFSLGRTPDVVIFHNLDSCFNYLQLRKDDNAKVVMFVHADGDDLGMLVNSFPKLKGTKLLEEIGKRNLFAQEHCDRIVFISKIARGKFLKSHTEIEEAKVAAVVNGIDNFPEPKKEITKFKYRLCTTGSVGERKGQYIVVEALHKMNHAILKDTHYTIIGVGEDFSKLMRRVEEYGLQKHVTFAGNVPNMDVHERLGKVNIYVLMSNNEGLPISILEAMRAGLPIISTPVAGIPETVDERNGIIINPGVDELVAILNKLPEYDWGQLGVNSRNRFEEEFTFDVMRNNYAKMINSLYK